MTASHLGNFIAVVGRIGALRRSLTSENIQHIGSRFCEGNECRRIR